METTAEPAPPWRGPDEDPPAPGEYRACLVPHEAAPSARRWWDGRGWSNPYHAHDPERLKAKVRAEPARCRPLWLPND